jgi:uncharacterized protein (TIGR03032 family)
MSASTSGVAAPASAPTLEISTSRQLLPWLAEQRLSLAFTTYQIGKLFVVGVKPGGEISVFERSFNRSMGLCTAGDGFYLSTLYQIWRFTNVLEPGQQADGFDRIYVPQVGWTTGDIDVHDMAVDADGRLVFVNTLFGCLATPSETHSFRPLWRPPFLSRLAAEDRCHLNGLAMKDGRPAYVSAIAETDVVDAWREHRADGGVLVDVEAGEVVARGLSMPHSPRWYRDRLWVLNSGTGELGHVELASGRFVPIAFCPGYLRGLSFCGDHALVGLSRARADRTFSGLPLDERLRSARVEPRCGLQVIDLRSGDVVHWLRLEGVVDELYDVVPLPGVRRPSIIGFKSDEIRRVISIEG